MNTFALISFCSLVLGAVASTLNTDGDDDLITSLPGISSDEITFNQYSGYLLADESSGAYIFYWFVESQSDPANDPVVWWSNGGPGCSGLIGFMTEHGPFRPQKDLTLEINDYSWNKLANMLYVEAPPGVGFSYANDTDVYNVNDGQTATYNYNAIQSFFSKFPSFRSNPFYITSESYGGHYIPELALKIVTENEKQNDTEEIINFKGFAVGNPYTSQLDNYYGAVETFWGHQVISYPTYTSWKNNCVENRTRGTCAELEVQMYNEIGGLNMYALDYPVCDSALVSQRIALLNHITPEHLKPYVPLAREVYQPCTDNYAVGYLNLKSVQEALHAKRTIWSECSYDLNYAEYDEALPMEPLYHALVNGGYDLHILVYSGDDDTVCATIGTQEWIYRLGYEETESWDSWSYTDSVYGEQLGGYLVKWDGLSFATVHGAGHEVPTYKPAAALQLFANFLNGVF